MQEPWSRVICREADGDVIGRVDAPNADNIAAYRVYIVVGIAVCAANNTEGMLKKNLTDSG